MPQQDAGAVFAGAAQPELSSRFANPPPDARIHKIIHGWPDQPEAQDKLIRKLQAQSGRDLLLSGSGRLLEGLNSAGLIDLFRLMVHPIVLGKGARLFAGGFDRKVLERTHHETFDSGIVILEYRPVEKS